VEWKGGWGASFRSGPGSVWWGVELNQANTKIKYKIEKIKKEFLFKVHI
jgi:hypothetical protein